MMPDDGPAEATMSMPEAITLDGLSLRRLQLTDRDALAAAVSESAEALSRWMPWAHPAYSTDDASNFLAAAWLGWNASTHYEFAIVAAQTGELLGLCGLNQRSGDAMNLGYWVRTAHAGQGIATRAARAVARFGFEHAGLRRITLYHAVENVGSQRVAQKAGFLCEGRERGRMVLQGVPHDCLTYGMLAEP